MKKGGSGAILTMQDLGFEAVVLRFLKLPQTAQIFKAPPAARSIQPESLVTNLSYSRSGDVIARAAIT